MSVHVTGVQIATKQIDEGIAAGQLAAEAGAAWMDLNCGCPIYGQQAFTVAFSHCNLALCCLHPSPVCLMELCYQAIC